MRGCLENFILNDLKQEIQYFAKHLENVMSVWPVKAPGWLLVWKVPSVTQVILRAGMCESSDCVQ